MSKKSHKTTQEKSDDPQDARRQELLNRVVTDPRFMLPGKSVKKVQIDDRFKEMFYSDKFRVSKGEERGSRVAKKEKNKELADYYYTKEKEENEKSESEEAEQAPVESEPESSDYEDEVLSEEDLWAEDRENIPREDKVSKRLAVVGLDWDQITAKDVMSIFSSLCKEGSSILKAEIYPSQFGKERMKHDSLYGPQGIWKSGDHKSDYDAAEEEHNDVADDKEKEKEEEKEEEEEGDEKEDEEEAENDSEEDDGNDDPTKVKSAKSNKGSTIDRERTNSKANKGFDPIALRKYELEKLRYFYAIVYCDSLATSQYLYDEYDGFEYENSSLKLDLRYVPDDLVFPDPPKDVCTKLDTNYEPKVQIVNSAVQNSNVKLTWEAPDPKRFELVSKNLSPDKLEEMDLKDYLGDESEESDDADKDVDKYRKLLTIGEEEGQEEKDDGKGELLVSFKGGLEEDVPEEAPEVERKEWKSGEKKRKLGKAGKGKKRKAEEEAVGEEETKKENELSLLIDRKKAMDDFKLDLGDNRFASLYKDKRYLIDPSSAIVVRCSP